MSKSRANLRKAAKLAIAIHGANMVEGVSPSEIGLSEKEWVIMNDEVRKICDRLAGNNSTKLGSLVLNISVTDN